MLLFNDEGITGHPTAGQCKLELYSQGYEKPLGSGGKGDMTVVLGGPEIGPQDSETSPPFFPSMWRSLLRKVWEISEISK